MSVGRFPVIRKKISDFVVKHGLTYQGFVVSILFFPPAAFYIACKKPGMPMAGRVAMNLVALVAPPLVGMATLASLKWVFDTARATF